MKSLFHGTRGVAHQIVNNFVIVQGLTKMLNMIGEGTPLMEFMKAMLRGYLLLPSVTKVEENDEEILLQGKGNLFQCHDHETERCLSNYFEAPLCDLRIVEYEKVLVDGVRYEKAKCTTKSKRSDSVVAYGPNQIGKMNILFVRQDVTFVIQPFLVERNKIVVDNETGACAEHIVKVKDEPLLPPLVLQASSILAKCVQVTVNNIMYCCILPNMVELD